MNKYKLTGIALAAGLFGSSAFAGSGFDVGVLTCKVTNIENMIVYTKEEFDCEFKQSNGSVENYTGQITDIGINLSVKNKFTIVWTVVAPTNVAYQPMSLRGTYVGTGADVALGGGVGVKVLVGGGENSFSLQPVSIAGVVGGGASIGIESFELR